MQLENIGDGVNLKLHLMKNTETKLFVFSIFLLQ